MKFNNLVPITIVLLAMLSPRLATGKASGGALPCDRAHKAHDCSGPTTCGSIATSVPTSNHAEQYYIEGETTQDCFYMSSDCQGRATSPDLNCVRL
jgi:hypothetical protein